MCSSVTLEWHGVKVRFFSATLTVCIFVVDLSADEPEHLELLRRYWAVCFPQSSFARKDKRWTVNACLFLSILMCDLMCCAFPGGWVSGTGSWNGFSRCWHVWAGASSLFCFAFWRRVSHCAQVWLSSFCRGTERDYANLSGLKLVLFSSLV